VSFFELMRAKYIDGYVKQLKPQPTKTKAAPLVYVSRKIPCPFRKSARGLSPFPCFADAATKLAVA
jgi:hypothetical protein